jgi:hypothetical protein
MWFVLRRRSPPLAESQWLRRSETRRIDRREHHLRLHFAPNSIILPLAAHPLKITKERFKDENTGGGDLGTTACQRAKIAFNRWNSEFDLK